eukprot:1669731-Ditylum_brightwellii.AAC.1
MQGDVLCLDVALAEVGVMKESIVLISGVVNSVDKTTKPDLFIQMMRCVLMSYSAVVRLCIKFLSIPTIILNMTMKMTMMVVNIMFSVYKK